MNRMSPPHVKRRAETHAIATRPSPLRASEASGLERLDFRLLRRSGGWARGGGTYSPDHAFSLAPPSPLISRGLSVSSTLAQRDFTVEPVLPTNRLPRRLHFDLPIPAVGLKAEDSDMGDVHGMLAVNSYKPVFFNEDHHVAERSNIDERMPRPKANLGLSSSCSEEVHVVRVEHATLSTGRVNEDSVRNDDVVVARPGPSPHGLAIQSMAWRSAI